MTADYEWPGQSETGGLCRQGNLMAEIHPFYLAHRDAMEAAMRQRLDLAEPMLRERAQLSDTDEISQEVMNEFEIVLVQMPYVGGVASRMSDFFMRFLGFMAIGRVLRRHGMALPVIGDIERETYKAQLLTVPEAERLASGRQFMSDENRALLREQAAKSHAEEYPDDFVYDFVEPGPGDRFEFGINYKACGFCKFAGRHGDQEILPHLCGLDFDAYATRGIRLERTQTLAGGASHCNFRFSRLEPE
jgi:L-2-amino-thiazoline-4-carboxylic acid hydrolase